MKAQGGRQHMQPNHVQGPGLSLCCIQGGQKVGVERELSLGCVLGAWAQVKNKANHFLLCRKRMVLVQLRAEDKRWKEAKQRRRRVHKVHASTALVKPSSERCWQRWPTFQKRVPDKKKGNSVKPFQGNRSSPSNIYLYCPLALIKNNLKGKLFLIQQQLILFSWA